jgi:hypothetical protein
MRRQGYTGKDFSRLSRRGSVERERMLAGGNYLFLPDCEHPCVGLRYALGRHSELDSGSQNQLHDSARAVGSGIVVCFSPSYRT